MPLDAAWRWVLILYPENDRPAGTDQSVYASIVVETELDADADADTETETVTETEIPFNSYMLRFLTEVRVINIYSPIQ